MFPEVLYCDSETLSRKLRQSYISLQED